MAARQGRRREVLGHGKVGGKRGHRRAELQFSRLLFMLPAGSGREHSNVQYELG